VTAVVDEGGRRRELEATHRLRRVTKHTRRQLLTIVALRDVHSAELLYSSGDFLLFKLDILKKNYSYSVE